MAEFPVFIAQRHYKTPPSVRPRRQAAHARAGRIRMFAALLSLISLCFVATVASAQSETDTSQAGRAPENGSSRSAAPAEANPAAPLDYHKAWFPVSGLNDGLPQPDRPLNRATPRAALESFLNLADREEFDHAAHLLDLALIPEEERASRGADLARKLNEIFSRRVWIDWGSIPDRPDAMQVIGTDSNQVAGEPRRTMRIAALMLEGRPVAIRLSRMKAPDQPPLWVFSAQTVGNIGKLYERYGPGWLEQKLPEWLKRKGPNNLPLWKILLLPVLIGVTILAAGAIYRAIRLFGRYARPDWLGLVVQNSSAPVAILAAFLIAQLIIGTLLPLTGPVNSVAQPAILGGIIASTAWIILRGLDTILDFASEKYVQDIGKEKNDASRRLYTNLSVARRIALLIAFIAGAGLLLSQLDLYQTVGISLLASAGIFSLIFGFAAQTVLGNILASLQIAISKPIRIGDSVFYEGQWGNVEEINYTFVLIRIWDDRRLVIPVRYFVSHPFENWSIESSHLLGTVDIKMDHRTDVEALRSKFAELVKENRNWDGKVEPQTMVVDHDDEGMTIRFYASAANASDAWYLQCDMREQLLAHVRELTDAPVYPHRRVLLERTQEGDGAAQGDGVQVKH